jgi:hypothetical protein
VQVVKHIVTEMERPLVYTDRAMTESSANLRALRDAELEGEDDDLYPQLVDDRAPDGNGTGGNGSGDRDGAESRTGGGSRTRVGRVPAASKPADQDDPDLTAIAAAVFGPRASTPTHTR